MPTRHLTRSRSFWSRGGRILGPSPFRGALIPTLVVLVLLPLLLLVVPSAWKRGQAAHFRDRWLRAASVQAEYVERRWMEPLVLPDIQRGDEPDVVAVLKAHPLVTALASTDGKRLWIRQGDRLLPGDPGAGGDSQRYLRWIRGAIRAGGYVWYPPAGGDPAAAQGVVGIFRQDPWISIRIWRVGSPEVEEHLRRSIPGESLIRVGMGPVDPARRQARPPSLPAWGEGPNLQVNLYAGRPNYLGGLITSEAFGPEWRWLCMETEKEGQALAQFLRMWEIEARVAIAFFLLVLWFGLFLWRRQRLGEAMDRDRLASMAHSLKTPLGLAKLRCDTLLHQPDPDPEAMAIALLRVSEDVDHLTLFIDDCLRGLSRAKVQRPRARIPVEAFQQVACDLAPAFQVEGRALELDLAPESALANETLLRTALITLLENALKYGVGPVLLRTVRNRSCLMVEVQNEGEGLDASQLNHLATPFLRFRCQGEEGFAQEGRGLGLFLLSQVAAHEGWALAFTSTPGRGFTATLGLPLFSVPSGGPSGFQGRHDLAAPSWTLGNNPECRQTGDARNQQ